MKVSISKKNKKVHCPNISLTPIASCANSKVCSKGCYAVKAYRQYPNVRTAWDRNFTLAMNDPAEYFNQIHEYLLKHKPRMFRWHVAGDILNQQYLEYMIDIASNLPDIKFLCFTKRYDLIYRLNEIPKNLSIVMSCWPGMPLPKQKLPRAFLQNGTEKRVKNALECQGTCENCGMCWHLGELKKNVVFHKH